MRSDPSGYRCHGHADRHAGAFSATLKLGFPSGFGAATYAVAVRATQSAGTFPAWAGVSFGEEGEGLLSEMLRTFRFSANHTALHTASSLTAAGGAIALTLNLASDMS